MVQKERVAKAFNKWLEGKPLTKVTPEEVVDFLIFKEMEGKGRTVVHRETCPRLGTTDLKGCQIECGAMHAYDSLTSGYFEKITSLFEEGGMGEDGILRGKKETPQKRSRWKITCLLLRRNKGWRGLHLDKQRSF